MSGVLAGSPLAGEANDFLTDAQNGGLNPLLLVAIAWAETQYGVTAPSGSKNAFGLMHAVKRNGQIYYVLSRFGSWSQGIISAVHTVDAQFVKGNVTVALLYSGQPGAYCVNSPGKDCSVGEGNVETRFESLGGGDPNNPWDLLWPCPN
jgi:hypothetical protein